MWIIMRYTLLVFVQLLGQGGGGEVKQHLEICGQLGEKDLFLEVEHTPESQVDTLTQSRLFQRLFNL